MFAFHSVLIKFLTLPVCFSNTETHSNIFLTFCPTPFVTTLISPTPVNFVTFLYSLEQRSASFSLPPFATPVKGMSSVYCCIGGEPNSSYVLAKDKHYSVCLRLYILATSRKEQFFNRFFVIKMDLKLR